MSEHKALLALPVVKFDAEGILYRGTCICGWVQKGFGSAKDARRATKNHVHSATNTRYRNQIEEADKTTAMPQQVIDALAYLVGDHYDFKTAAWERASTGIAVFTGEGGSVAIRYVLSADLSSIVCCGKVGSDRLSWGTS